MTVQGHSTPCSFPRLRAGWSCRVGRCSPEVLIHQCQCSCPVSGAGKVWWAKQGTGKHWECTRSVISDPGHGKNLTRSKWILWSCSWWSAGTSQGTALCWAPGERKLAAKLAPQLTMLFSQNFTFIYVHQLYHTSVPRAFWEARWPLSELLKHSQLTQIISNCSAYFRKKNGLKIANVL